MLLFIFIHVGCLLPTSVWFDHYIHEQIDFSFPRVITGYLYERQSTYNLSPLPKVCHIIKVPCPPMKIPHDDSFKPFVIVSLPRVLDNLLNI